MRGRERDENERDEKCFSRVDGAFMKNRIERALSEEKMKKH